MIPKDLADQVKAEVKELKSVQDRFLQTYQQIVVHFGGPDWRKRRSRSSAVFKASSLIMTMAFNAAPRLSCASMRFRYCSTSDRQVSDPSRKAL